jgi:hypothetical protein
MYTWYKIIYPGDKTVSIPRVYTGYALKNGSFK